MGYVNVLWGQWSDLIFYLVNKGESQMVVGKLSYRRDQVIV